MTATIGHSDGLHTLGGVTPRRSLVVVGLDVSLTSTGVALIADRAAKTWTIKSKATKDATIEERAKRLREIRFDCMHAASGASVVVIESPAYGQTTGSHHDRSGAWWLIVDALLPDVEQLVEATPQAVKMYATGKGNAGKDEVLAAVVRRYPDVDVRSNDEADALVLAAIGARLAGHPIDELPATHLRALDKIRWIR